MYYVTIGQTALCESCLGATDAIRVNDDLVIVVEEGRLLVRRGGFTVEVLLYEARQLVDALVEGPTGVEDWKTQEK